LRSPSHSSVVVTASVLRVEKDGSRHVPCRRGGGRARPRPDPSRHGGSQIRPPSTSAASCPCSPVGGGGVAGWSRWRRSPDAAWTRAATGRDYAALPADSSVAGAGTRATWCGSATAGWDLLRRITCRRRPGPAAPALLSSPPSTAPLFLPFLSHCGVFHRGGQIREEDEGKGGSVLRAPGGPHEMLLLISFFCNFSDFLLDH